MMWHNIATQEIQSVHVWNGGVDLGWINVVQAMYVNVINDGSSLISFLVSVAVFCNPVVRWRGRAI